MPKATWDTSNILEYIYFGFYDQVLFKNNPGTSPFDPGRWLGVSHILDRIMCYHVLTQQGTVIYRSKVQRDMNLELATSSMTDIYRSFDAKIHETIKLANRDYMSDKTSTEDWSDMMDEDEEFD